MDTESPELRLSLVRWTYRLMLGREPESAAAEAGWAAAGLGALREGVLGAPEFLARLAGGQAGAPMPGIVPDRDAAEAALALRDGRLPSPAAVDALLREGPDLEALRCEVFSAPDVQAALPGREGLRRRVLRMGDAAWTVLGDTRDPLFAEAPGSAPALCAALRAIHPGGGEGMRLLDSGAGIGLATLAMAAALPRHAGLVAHEQRLPEAAFLAVNLAGNPAARGGALAVPAPPVAALEAEGLPAVLRLGTGSAVAEALAHAGALAAATLVLRFALRDVLIEARADPRGALEALAERFPGGAWIADAATPVPVSETDALLDAALHAPLDLVLRQDTAWRERFSPL